MTAAIMGLIIELINELIAFSTQARTLTFFDVLACALGVAAVILGVYAQATQTHHWDRYKQQCLLIGLPVALLTLVIVTPNLVKKTDPAAPPRAAVQAQTVSVPPAEVSEEKVDDSLVKPGWYGELRLDSVLLTVSSYEDNAFEAKRFNRRLFKPVSYATYTVINLGSATPVTLPTLQVKIHLNSGNVVPSLPIEPLLSQRAEANQDLIKRLALPQLLGIGEMLSNVPICMEAGFSWADVTGISVTIGAHEIVIPGRIMTVEEKQSLLDRSTARRPVSDGNAAAETWYKGL